LLSLSSVINLWCGAMVVLFNYGAASSISAPYLTYCILGLGAIVGYCFFYLTRRRLQDLNCPAAWARVFAFPFFGVVLLPVLLFLSSPRYANYFGDAPPPSGFFKVSAAFLSFLAALLLVHYVTDLYAPPGFP
jgi:uncharacterized membrane protein YhaH (DUF805 family)